MPKKEKKGSESAAEKLGDWRAAGRDVAAAEAAETVADQALAAAQAAQDAVAEVEEAAREALEAAREALKAATRAQAAAGHAKRAASHAAEAADLASVSAKGDKARAAQAVTQAEQEEGKARDLFHEAEKEALSKDETA